MDLLLKRNGTFFNNRWYNELVSGSLIVNFIHIRRYDHITTSHEEVFSFEFFCFFVYGSNAIGDLWTRSFFG